MDRTLLFGLFLLLSIALFSSADDCLWTCVEGDFSRQDCWSCGHLPNNTDTINVKNASIFVSQEVSLKAATLDLVNLTLYSGTFDVTGTLSLSHSVITATNEPNITNTNYTTISTSQLQMANSSLFAQRNITLSTKLGNIHGVITAATNSILTFNGNFSIDANLYGNGTITSYENATLYIAQNTQLWEVNNGNLFGVIFTGPSSVTTTKSLRLQKPILRVESPPLSWNETIPLMSGPVVTVNPVLAGKFSCFGGVFDNSEGLRFNYHFEPVLTPDSEFFSQDLVLRWTLPSAASQVCGGFTADRFDVKIDDVTTTNVTVGQNITVSNSAFPGCGLSTVSVQIQFRSKTYPHVHLITQSSTTARSVRSLFTFQPNISFVNITYDDVNVTVGWSAPANTTWPCDSTLENTNVFLTKHEGDTMHPDIRLPTTGNTVHYTWTAKPCNSYSVVYNVSLVTPDGFKYTTKLSNETPKLVFAPVSAVPSLPSISQFSEDSQGHIRTLLTWGLKNPQCGPCDDKVSDLHREISYNGTKLPIYGGTSDFIVDGYNMTIVVEERDVCVYGDYTFKSKPVMFNVTVPPHDKIFTRATTSPAEQVMPKSEMVAIILFAVLLALSGLAVAAVMFRKWQLKQRVQYTTLN